MIREFDIYSQTLRVRHMTMSQLLQIRTMFYKEVVLGYLFGTYIGTWNGGLNNLCFLKTMFTQFSKRLLNNNSAEAIVFINLFKRYSGYDVTMEYHVNLTDNSNESRFSASDNNNDNNDESRSGRGKVISRESLTVIYIIK